MESGIYVNKLGEIYFFKEQTGTSWLAEDLSGKISKISNLEGFVKPDKEFLINKIKELNSQASQVKNFYRAELELTRENEYYEILADNLSKKYKEKLENLGFSIFPYADGNSRLDENELFCDGKKYIVEDFLQMFNSGSLKPPKKGDFRRGLESASFDVETWAR